MPVIRSGKPIFKVGQVIQTKLGWTRVTKVLRQRPDFIDYETEYVEWIPAAEPRSSHLQRIEQLAKLRRSS